MSLTSALKDFHRDNTGSREKDQDATWLVSDVSKFWSYQIPHFF